MVGVAPIEDKLRENKLRWFGQKCRRPTDVVVRRNNMIIGNDNTRGKGRPKFSMDAVLKKDMIELNLSEHLALDRAQ